MLSELWYTQQSCAPPISKNNECLLGELGTYFLGEPGHMNLHPYSKWTEVTHL